MREAVFAEGLTKTYNGKAVVDHLNLSVKSGTVFGLLGANGAGKSTTIECMLGTKRADSGTVRLLGQDPSRQRRALFQRIGVQFQEGDYHIWESRRKVFCYRFASWSVLARSAPLSPFVSSVGNNFKKRKSGGSDTVSVRPRRPAPQKSTCACGCFYFFT